VALFLMSSVRERLEVANVPPTYRGFPSRSLPPGSRSGVYGFFRNVYLLRVTVSMDPVLVKSALIAVAVLDASDCSSHRLGSCGPEISVKANPKVEEVLEVLAGAQ